MVWLAGWAGTPAREASQVFPLCPGFSPENRLSAKSSTLMPPERCHRPDTGIQHRRAGTFNAVRLPALVRFQPERQ